MAATICWEIWKLVWNGRRISDGQALLLAQKSVPIEELQMAATICWEIWNRKNQLVWNRRRISDGQALLLARKSVEQWRDMHTIPTSQQLLAAPLEEKWSPMLTGYTKCNFDGALFEDKGEVGMGFLLRDHQGFLLRNA